MKRLAALVLLSLSLSFAGCLSLSLGSKRPVSDPTKKRQQEQQQQEKTAAEAAGEAKLV